LIHDFLILVVIRGLSLFLPPSFQKRSDTNWSTLVS
jgi:hypothetical protein